MNKITLTTAQQNYLIVCAFFNSNNTWAGLKRAFNQEQDTRFTQDEIKAEYLRLHGLAMEAGKVAISW